MTCTVQPSTRESRLRATFVHRSLLTQRVNPPPPIGERSIVMSVSVCLCMCVSLRDHIFGTTRPIFTIFVHVTYGGGWIGPPLVE